MKSWSIFASIRFGPLGAGLSFHMSEMFPKRRVKTWSSFVLLKGILNLKLRRFFVFCGIPLAASLPVYVPWTTSVPWRRRVLHDFWMPHGRFRYWVPAKQGNFLAVSGTAETYPDLPSDPWHGWMYAWIIWLHRDIHTDMFIYHIYVYIYTYLHIYIYIYIHIYIYTYLHIYIYIYIFTYIHIYIFTYIHIYIYTYLHIYINTYLHIYLHIYLYIYIYIFTNIYIYTYLHLYTYLHIYIFTYLHIYIHIYMYIYIYFFTYLHIYIYIQMFQKQGPSKNRIRNKKNSWIWFSFLLRMSISEDSRTGSEFGCKQQWYCRGLYRASSCCFLMRNHKHHAMAEKGT